MPTPTPQRRSTTQRKQRISSLFWELADGDAAATDSREPEAVVRHLLAVLNSLEGRRESSASSANALSFLLQLESDPFYASPEQNRGGEKDARALVYSIGVLLFERLTGHHPFVESLSPLQSRVTRDRAHRLGSNNLASIPSELRGVLVRAMSPFPEERHRDVNELHADLELYLGRADTVVAPLMSQSPMLRPALGTHPPMQPRSFARGSQPHRVARPRRRSSPPPCPGSPDRRIYDMVKRSTTASPSAAATVIRQIPQMRRARARQHWAHRYLPFLVGTGVFIIASCLVIIVAASTVDSPSAQRAAAASVVPADEADEAAPVVAAKADKADKADETTPVVAAETDEAAADADAEIPHAETTIAVPATHLPDAFDPAFAAEQAAERSRGCFTEARLSRGVQIDATLRFRNATAEADKVYFASGHKLSRAERECLSENLAGSSAGVAPSRTTLVTYTWWLSDETSRHRVHKRK